MKHKVGYNRLGRKTSHCRALRRNMATSVILHERIKTTKAKALSVRRVVEKMVTRAKVDSVHNRRMVARDIKDEKALAKLFTEIGPRFVNRPGGYTRILKLGPRKSDASEMVLLEFVDRPGAEEESQAKVSRKRAKAEKKEADRKAAEEAAAAEEAEAEAEAAEADTESSDAKKSGAKKSEAKKPAKGKAVSEKASEEAPAEPAVAPEERAIDNPEEETSE
jgi:large subunit ribosomal protein L17